MAIVGIPSLAVMIDGMFSGVDWERLMGEWGLEADREAFMYAAETPSPVKVCNPI